MDKFVKPQLRVPKSWFPRWLQNPAARRKSGNLIRMFTRNVPRVQLRLTRAVSAAGCGNGAGKGDRKERHKDNVACGARRWLDGTGIACDGATGTPQRKLRPAKPGLSIQPSNTRREGVSFPASTYILFSRCSAHFLKNSLE